MTRPNILLIYTDQQRFNTIGALGNPLIRTHDWKFVQDGDTGELYDLTRDPHELVNLCGHPDCRAVEARLRSDLEGWKQILKSQSV